jgi:hypothetical protein
VIFSFDQCNTESGRVRDAVPALSVQDEARKQRSEAVRTFFGK